MAAVLADVTDRCPDRHLLWIKILYRLSWEMAVTWRHILGFPAAAIPCCSWPRISHGKNRRLLLVSCNANGKGKILPGSSQSDSSPDWGTIGLCLFGTGFVLGPLLDGIHSAVELQVYDNWAVKIGSLSTNIWVFPILGTFYTVTGLLHLALDAQFGSGKERAPTLTKLALCFVSLVLFLELSAEMYKADVPYNIEAYALFAAAQFNWAFFESTWYGFALASLIAVACPLLEVPIIRWFNLWHYSKPDFFIMDEGLVTWVICCYFAYTPFLANLSRWLKQSIAQTRTSRTNL